MALPENMEFDSLDIWVGAYNPVVYLCAAGNSDGPVQSRSCRESAGHEPFNRGSRV
jgi:hypothetical protein